MACCNFLMVAPPCLLDDHRIFVSAEQLDPHVCR